MKKNYVLDTNVLITNPEGYECFDEHNVYIPLVVIEELDHLKSRQDDVGLQARTVIRNLDELTRGKDRNDISTAGGGRLSFILTQRKQLDENQLDFDKNDNKIIEAVITSEIRFPILVTQDANLRVKAAALGITSEDFKSATGAYKKEIVQVRADDKVVLSASEFETFCSQKSLDTTGWNTTDTANEFVTVINELNNATMLGRWRDNTLHVVKNKPVYGVSGQNKEQWYALDVLMDPKVSLVLLTGAAGSGKTLLALAAGMEQLDKTSNTLAKYNKLIVTRSVIPVGKDIGYLPGTIEEKMLPWIGSVRDNLIQLLPNSNKGGGDGRRGSQGKSGRDSKNPYGTSSQLSMGDPYLDLMIEKGEIEIAAISHVRGRSIANSYFIVDEAQNLTIHELKTIITRAGQGTKVVLMGDMSQIDNPHVNAKTCGLSIVVDRFAGKKIAAHASLIRGVRSELATLASEIL